MLWHAYDFPAGKCLFKTKTQDIEATFDALILRFLWVILDILFQVDFDTWLCHCLSFFTIPFIEEQTSKESCKQMLSASTVKYLSCHEVSVIWLNFKLLSQGSEFSQPSQVCKFEHGSHTQKSCCLVFYSFLAYLWSFKKWPVLMILKYIHMTTLFPRSFLASIEFTEICWHHTKFPYQNVFFFKTLNNNGDLYIMNKYPLKVSNLM